jgi:hypothetical protein
VADAGGGDLLDPTALLFDVPLTTNAVSVAAAIASNTPQCGDGSLRLKRCSPAVGPPSVPQGRKALLVVYGSI